MNSQDASHMKPNNHQDINFNEQNKINSSNINPTSTSNNGDLMKNSPKKENNTNDLDILDFFK